jgi:iron(III) transport system substrate-binding protein
MKQQPTRSLPRISRRSLVGTVVFGGAAALLGCQPRAADSPTSAVPAGAPSAPVVPEAQRQWNELIEAAKREGRVVVSSAPAPRMRTELPAAFQKRFGIEMEYVGARTGDVLTRLEAERAAGQYNLDVLVGGATSLYTQAYPKGWLDPVRPALVDPDVTDGSKWLVGRPWFMDPEEQYILRLSNQSTLIATVNQQYFPASEIRTWRDLLDPRYRGKISVYDPGVSGTGWNTANYLLRQLGEDYLRGLYIDQQPGISREERQLADWLARGTYPISLGLNPTEIEPLRADGFPIAVVLADTPEAPGIVSAGWSLGTILNRAPNPNAAKLFLNWVASREGQEVWNSALEYVSVRSDLSSDWAPDYAKPKPDVNYFDSYQWDFVLSTRSPEELEKLRRIVGRGA